MSQAAKEAFLRTYKQEVATTLRVLRAYPEEKLDLKPWPGAKSAKELGWLFVQERGLATAIWNDAFGQAAPPARQKPPEPPAKWSDLVAAYEKASADFAAMIAAASEDDLRKPATFMVGPKKPGELPRMEWMWFLLHDEIHHRGQFSVYLRMAGGKLPSVYGPTADEPWM